MRKRAVRYFHIHSNGFVEEISHEKFFQYVVKEGNWANRKLVVRLHPSEISFHKRGTICIPLKSLEQILGMKNGISYEESQRTQADEQ